MRRLTIATSLAALLLLGAAGPAAASPPSGVIDQVSDGAAVLTPAQEEQARDALQELSARTGTAAYVVFVDSFDGTDRSDWAASSAEQTGLDSDDLLLAVAVQDRKFGVWRGDDLAPAAVQQVLADQVQPLLSEGDWVGASLALAEGLGVTADTPVPADAPGPAGAAPADSSSGGGGAALAVVLVLLLLAGGGYWFFRSRRRPVVAEPVGPPDPHAGTPTDQLNFRASSALLDLDERVRSAQVDLDYAVTHFGQQAVPGMAEAMDRSRAELARAFAIRQELDDEIPEDEPTQRRMLTELLTLTDAAGERLQAQRQAIEVLREQERTAPEILAALQQQVDDLRGRLPGEQGRLGGLQERYAASAVAPVLQNVAEAEVRLAAAAQGLELARSDQAGGQAGRSVGRLRGAENAVGQSRTLLDAIGRLAGDLTAAEQRIPVARADIEEDLAEARLLDPATRTDLRPQIARAEAALRGADVAMHPAEGGPDPLAALRRLEEADLALEQALSSARDEQTRTRRAQEALGQGLLTARSAVAAAEDFISTRRGAIGSTARTRLAEAQRHLSVAEAQAEEDPAGALQEAHVADQLAQLALQTAGSEVEQWSRANRYVGYGGWGAGGYGGGYGRGGGLGPVGAGLGGLLLGGLIFGGDGGGGGDWDAGDFGGGFGGGDFGGGDFGGGSFGGDFGGGDF